MIAHTLTQRRQYNIHRSRVRVQQLHRLIYAVSCALIWIQEQTHVHPLLPLPAACDSLSADDVCETQHLTNEHVNKKIRLFVFTSECFQLQLCTTVSPILWYSWNMELPVWCKCCSHFTPMHMRNIDSFLFLNLTLCESGKYPARLW